MVENLMAEKADDLMAEITWECIEVNEIQALTHYSPLLLIYTSWKYQKN